MLTVVASSVAEEFPLKLAKFLKFWTYLEFFQFSKDFSCIIDQNLYILATLILPILFTLIY